MFAAYRTILPQIKQLKEQNKVIISMLNRQGNENIVETRLPDNFPIQLPTKSLEDFHSL